MNTNDVDWKSKDISIHSIYTHYKDETWTIPSYQRGFVWEEKRIKSLVESMLLGYPLGSILIWSNKGNSIILDGQQRTISLLKIRNKPFKYLSDLSLEKIIDEKPKKDLLNFIFSCKDYTIEEILTDKSIFSKKIENLIDEFEIKVRYQEKLLEFIDFLQSDNPIITRINASGFPAKFAIDLFERINTQGIKLNYFEILSARWSESKIKIKDQEFTQKINELYNFYYEEIGFPCGEIKERDLNQMTPAELMYSIFLIAFKDSTFFKGLFFNNKVKNMDTISSSNLESLLWILRYFFYKEKKEDKWIENYKVDDKNIGADKDIGLSLKSFSFEKIKKFKESLEKAVIEFSKNIKPLMAKTSKDEYAYLKFNGGKNLPLLALSQIFWRVFNDEKISTKDWKNMSLWILDHWFNSEFSSSTTETNINVLKEERFFQEISLKRIEDVIDSYEKKQRQQKETKKNFRAITKYMTIVAYQSNHDFSIANFHHDHILPFAKVKETNSFGINSIGNCGMLKEKENLKKGQNFIPEFFAHDKLINIAKDFDKQKYKNMIQKIIKTNYSNKYIPDFYDYRFKHIKTLFMLKLKNFMDS